MAEPHTTTMRSLIHDVISDARALVHGEVALLRAEVREQTVEAKRLAMLFGGALALALVAIVLLFVALAAGLAVLFGTPAWASFAGMAVLVAAGAAFVFSHARSALSRMNILPKTRASVQENIAWIQSKYSSS
jgi:uncharacterized membrane protein YqjE